MSTTEGASTAATPRSSRAYELWLAIALIALWILLLTSFGDGDVYSIVGPYACVVCVVCYLLRPRDLRAALKPDVRGVLSGLALGVAMTVVTYPVFRFATQLVPGLDAQVQGLYIGAQSTTVPKALAWLSVLTLAEELLFRGLLPLALRSYTGPRKAYALSVIAYAVGQLGSGSLIVALLALCCGIVWTILRAWSGSLLSSVIAHAIWTPVLIVLYPVT